MSRTESFTWMPHDALVPTDFDSEAVVSEITSRLRQQYPDLDSDRIDAVVREEVERLRQATVTDYVSVLTFKAARKRLRHDG